MKLFALLTAFQYNVIGDYDALEITEKSLLDVDLSIEEELEPAAELYEAVLGN